MPFQVVETYWNISEKTARLAEIYAQADGKAVFLVPSGLDKELLLRIVSGCGSFLGEHPHIWTWSDFYDHCARVGSFRKRRVIDPPDHKLIVAQILKEYLSKAKEKKRALPPGVARGGFADVLGDNMRELLNEEVFPAQMQDAFAFGETSGTPESILCALYAEYIAYLEEYGLADSAQLPTLTGEAIGSDADVAAFIKEHVFVCVGFLSFTGGQKKLIHLLKNIANTLFILPETGLNDFYDAIRQVDEAYLKRPEWAVGIARLHAGNIQQQFSALARELALWACGKSSLSGLGTLGGYGEVGIQVSPEHLRLLENALARYKIPSHAQVRGSVADTLLGGLPRLIWSAWQSRWETRKTASLLSSPLFGDIAPDAALLAKQFPEGRAAWESFLSGRALEIFKSLNRLCLDLKKGGTPLAVMELWRDFTDALEVADALANIVGDAYDLDRVIKDAVSVLSELDKKIESLRDLKRDIGRAADTELRGADAVRFILDWGSTATLPIPLPQSRSVTIYAGPPPVLSSHKYWAMTNVDYNNWPGTLRESPLLSGDHKKMLNDAEESDPFHPHIPELHEKRQQKEALFRRLIATATSGVILTRSMTDAQKRPIGESQFVASMLESPAPRSFALRKTLEYPVSKMVPCGGDTIFAGAEVPIEAPQSDFGVYPRAGEFPLSPEKNEVSVSSIDSWLACPYAYWCERKLRLERPKRELFDPMRAGTFLHVLWELSWKDYTPGEQSFAALALAHWDEAIRAAYPELGDDARLARHSKRLRKQALNMAETLDRIEAGISGRKQVLTEHKVREYPCGGIVFNGRADRIDVFGDGFVVFDYKSGKADAHKDELQLAAYCLMLREETGLEPKGYGWLGHRDAKLYGYFDDAAREMYSAGKPKKISLGEQLGKAAGAMKDMSTAVSAGSYPAIYSTNDKQNPRCKSCPYPALCRRRGAPGFEAEEPDGNEMMGGGTDD